MQLPSPMKWPNGCEAGCSHRDPIIKLQSSKGSLPAMTSHSRLLSYARPDGGSASGYWVGKAEPGPGLVVIQEWWGLNEQIKKTADQLACQGYRVLVPDLYRGTVATEASQAQMLMTSLNWGDAVSQDIQGAVNYLTSHGSSQVAVLGFCMGGALTLLAAAGVSGLRAAVCFYGIPPLEVTDLSQIGIPVLAHFAQSDDWCTPELVNTLEQTFQRGGVNYELHRYQAQHAFINESRPEVYAPAAAEIAWQRTTDFLASHLV